MKKRIMIIITAVALLAACEPQERKQVRLQVREPGRFVLERVEEYEDFTSRNHRRHVYILKDLKTGREYIGINGIGIAQLESGK